jgi:hypothetical protein
VRLSVGQAAGALEVDFVAVEALAPSFFADELSPLPFELEEDSDAFELDDESLDEPPDELEVRLSFR